MKRIIAKHIQYNSVLHVLSKHQEATASIAALKQYAGTLNTRIGRMSQILSEISVPVSLLYSCKQNAGNNMITAIKKYASLGLLIASAKNDEVMMVHVKICLSQLRKVSSYRMMQNAFQLVKILEAHQSELAGYGISINHLNEFKVLAQEFGKEMETLSNKLLRRKSLRSELAALIAGTNEMLHFNMDAMVAILRNKYPAFYREYMLIRKPYPRKKRTVKKKATASETLPLAVTLPIQISQESKPIIKEVEELITVTFTQDDEALIPESFLVELIKQTETGIVFGNADN